MDFNVIPENIGDDNENHTEIDGFFKSMSGEHPIWSNELVGTINTARKWANTKEKELSGKIPDNVFESLLKAQIQTKAPADIVAFLMDWDQDITGGGGDAMGIGMKLVGYVNGLRSAFGRDPTHGEILAAHALGGAGQVKQLYDLAKQNPEKIAEPLGGKEIIWKKLRNGKDVKRTNREAYDFFAKRMINGRLSFKMNLGSANGVQSALSNLPDVSKMMGGSGSGLAGALSALSGSNLSSLTSQMGNMSSVGGLASMFGNFGGSFNDIANNSSNPLTENGLADIANTDNSTGLSVFASFDGGSENGEDTSGGDSTIGGLSKNFADIKGSIGAGTTDVNVG